VDPVIQAETDIVVVRCQVGALKNRLLATIERLIDALRMPSVAPEREMGSALVGLKHF